MDRQPAILLVEDDTFVRQFQVRLLGYAVPNAIVFEAAGVQDALAILETEQFALVITDHNLPDGSGMQIIRSIRQYNKELPIILTSAYYGNEFGARAAGATCFLPKPIELDHFLTTITPLLQRFPLMESVS
jgi:CheY-like chemotaxis protein